MDSGKWACVLRRQKSRTDAASNNYHTLAMFGYGSAKSAGSAVDELPAISGPRAEVWERAAPGGERPVIDALMYGSSVTSVTDADASRMPSRRGRTQGQQFDSRPLRVLAQSPYCN
jgi:hypothetical protein